MILPDAPKFLACYERQTLGLHTFYWRPAATLEHVTKGQNKMTLIIIILLVLLLGGGGGYYGYGRWGYGGGAGIGLGTILLILLIAYLLGAL